MKYLLILLLFCSCSVKPKQSVELLDTLYKAKYAQRFVLFDKGDSVVLRVKNPWQGATDVSFDYSFPKRYAVPPKIVCMSTSHVAFLDALGGCENIVGVSGIQFITNPKIKVAGVKDVGYDNNLNYELVVALKPDYLFVYEVAGENSATTKKLTQLGIPIIYIADYLEQSPLARSEWVVAFGAILGREEQAIEIFEEIATKYNQTKDSVAKIADRKPKVMLNSPYRDVWYMPGDKSYIVQLINDAGGEYLAAGVDDDVSRPVSSEVAFEMLSRADLWLNPSIGAKSKRDLLSINQRLKSLNVFQKGEIYNNNARSTPEGGSDFWESGSLRADRVLMDLAKIINPLDFKQERLYYFKKIEN